MTIIGTLIAIYSCHDFDCRRIRATPISCQATLSLNQSGRFGEIIGEARIAGTTYQMEWFQMGPDALHGQSGMQTFTLFYRGDRPKQGFVHYYSTRKDYVKYECRY